MGDPSRGKNQPADDNTESSAGPSGLGPWVRRNWLLSAAIGALVTSSVGFLVNQFGPEVIEGLSGDPPFRFVVREDDDAYTEGTVALPHGPPTGAFPAAASCQEVRGWAMGKGGIDAGRTHLKISIEGLNRTPVLIESMRARVEGRREPIDDTLVACALEGLIEVIGIGFDLDEQPSLARSIKQDGGLGRPFFERSSITVAEGEILTLAVTAFAEQCFCQWRIEIDLVVEGERQTFVIDDNGQPFQTTAAVSLPSHRVVWWGGKEWTSCDGDVYCEPGRKPVRLTAEELESLRREGTTSVLPPH
jgi:hypothetical protein